MARIRELQPAHKSDKVTVGEAARAFRKVQGGSGKRVDGGERHVRRDENGRFTDERADVSANGARKGMRLKAG
jgi:hypothetical protein